MGKKGGAWHMLISLSQHKGNSAFRDPVTYFIKTDDFFACSKPRKSDLEQYSCHTKLRKVNQKFLDRKFRIWQNKYGDIINFMDKTSQYLEDSISIEKFLGNENELTDEFIKLLDDFDLTIDDGFKIRKHIIDAFDKNQLNIYSYRYRVVYLMSNMEDVELEIGEYSDDITKCPFCNCEVPFFFNSCMFCGLSIRHIENFQEYILKNFSIKSLIKNKIKSIFKR